MRIVSNGVPASVAVASLTPRHTGTPSWISARRAASSFAAIFWEAEADP